MASRSVMPPPCLTIQIPGKNKVQQSNFEAPAFGIPSYSFRALRRPLPNRQRVTPAHFSPSNDKPAIHVSAVSLSDKRQSSSSSTTTRKRASSNSSSASWTDSEDGGADGGDESSTLAHVAKARIVVCHPKGLPSNPNQYLQQKIMPSLEVPDVPHSTFTSPSEEHLRSSVTSTRSPAHSSYHSHQPSPNGTFLSVATSNLFNGSLSRHPSRAPTPEPCREQQLRNPFTRLASIGRGASSSSSSDPNSTTHEVQQQSDRLPPIYSTHVPPRRSAVVVPVVGNDEPRTALGEGPGGRKETETDRLKRLYLCPWEKSSPSAIRRQQQQTSSYADLEKQQPTEVWDDGRRGRAERGEVAVEEVEQRREDTKKAFIWIIVAILLTILFADLLLLNIKLLPLAFE
ncbi:hypothetical protein T439DRAFT_354578 [Meredithblackwellia eburnea MCA 4105]